MAYALFLIIVALAAVQFMIQKRWVFTSREVFSRVMAVAAPRTDLAMTDKQRRSFDEQGSIVIEISSVSRNSRVGKTVGG
jgi:hypothetical protein